MKFLKSFWKTLRESIHKFALDKLNPDDNLGRYLTSSSSFSKKNNRVKYTALMPRKNSQTEEFETSIFNIEGLGNTEIINLARENILPNLAENRSVYGTGITCAKHINDVGLSAKISEPPEKHLNIIGWPDEKSKRKQLAMELAPLCRLSLFENSLAK